MLDGYMKSQEQKMQDLIYLAWHIEAFARQKKLPKLEGILKKMARRKPQEQKADKGELINIARLKGLKGPWTCG